MLQPVTQAFESLLPEQLFFLRALSEHGVEFTVVGGYAMRSLGHTRLTNDLDLVIKQTDDNVARVGRLLETLPDYNASGREPCLMQPEKKVVWKGVELFSTMKGFLYSEIEAESLHCQVQELRVRTMSLEHMKRAKTLALAALDRHGKKDIDEADLAFLRAKSEA